MTDREREIREAERKALAEVRRWRRELQKELEVMTPEEEQEYWRKFREELKADGHNVVSSLH